MKKSELKQLVRECLREVMINQQPTDINDSSNNPFNSAQFAKGYRSTKDSFVTLIGDGGTTSEGLMEDIHAAMELKDKQALKDSIDSFDRQIQISIKHWNEFKIHLQSKL